MVAFGDSFFTHLLGPLAQHFETTSVYSIRDPAVSRYWNGRVDGETIARERADVVVLELYERYLRRLLDAPQNIDRACGGT